MIFHSYPNLDVWSECSTKPIAVGTEAEGSDDIVVVQRVKMLAVIQVPQHRLAVLKKNREINLKVTEAFNITDTSWYLVKVTTWMRIRVGATRHH